LEDENIYTYFIGSVFRNPLREFIGEPYTLMFDYTPPRFIDTMTYKYFDKYIFKTRIYDGLGVKWDSIYIPDYNYLNSHDSVKIDTFFFTVPKLGNVIRFYLKAKDLAGNERRFPDTGFIYIKEGLYGIIPHDTIFEGEIKVIGDIIIPENVNVYIRKGTKFIFSGNDILKSGIDTSHIEIIVYGKFYSEGSAPQNVIFEIENEGKWYGIRYLNGSEGKIEYSIIKDAIKGISLESEKVEIILNEIRENETGIEFKGGYSLIFANKIYLNRIGFESNSNYGLAILSYNSIFENDSAGVLIKGRYLTLGNLYNSDTLDDGANRIYDNRKYNIINLTPYEIYAQGNFWKSIDSSFIDSKIYDEDESNSSGKVHFNDFYIWGKLCKKTTWKGIVSIGGDVIVPKHGKLIILPKTKVRFIKKFDITKSGRDTSLSEIIFEKNSKIENLKDVIFISDGFIKEKGDFYGIIFEENKEEREENIKDIEFSENILKSSTFFDNLKFKYSYKGIEFLRKKEKLKVKNSEIGNSIYGIYFNGEIIEIENSKIYTCDTGISILNGKGHIKETEIKENDLGILFSGDSHIDIDKSYIMQNKIGIYVNENSKPRLKNGYNYICSNLAYNLYNNTIFDIDARMNYWGTQNYDSISLFIYDFYDDSTKGIVNFIPIWVPKEYSFGGIQDYDFKNYGEDIIIKSLNFEKSIEIKIVLHYNSFVELNIYNVIGRKLKEIKGEFKEGIYKFKIEDLKKGIYFVEVKTLKNKKRFKVVKF
jgi:hypothetical protein